MYIQVQSKVWVLTIRVHLYVNNFTWPVASLGVASSWFKKR
jgi:hypothetical protein